MAGRLRPTAVFRKQCPYCGGSSYSASAYFTWICPYCGADLTGVEAEVAGGRVSQER